jgi:hypothetical protein
LNRATAAALATLAGAAALSGVSIGRQSHKGEPCPKCPRGKLQGAVGKRYCQRCSWFEAGERERVEAAVTLLGGGR